MISRLLDWLFSYRVARREVQDVRRDLEVTNHMLELLLQALEQQQRKQS